MTIYAPTAHYRAFHKTVGAGADTPAAMMADIELVWGSDAFLAELATLGIVNVVISDTAPGDTTAVWVDPAGGGSTDQTTAAATVSIYNNDTTAWETATPALFGKLICAYCTGTGTYANPTPPTVTDDNTAGYLVGDHWIDTSVPIIYTLADASTGAAKWLLEGDSIAVVPTGTVDAITTTGTIGTRLKTGQMLSFIAAGSNTGPVTIDGVAVVKGGANPLVAGDIRGGLPVEIIFDGANYQLLQPGLRFEVATLADIPATPRIGALYYVQTNPNGVPCEYVYNGTALVIQARQRLDSAITLHVETTGNDTTGDGTAALPFLTINAAHNYARNFSVTDSGSIVIELGSGTHAPAAPTFSMQHPDSGHITIRGQGAGTTVLRQTLYASSNTALSVEELTIDRTTDPIYSGVQTYPSSHAVLSNCVVMVAGGNHGVMARAGSSIYIYYTDVTSTAAAGSGLACVMSTESSYIEMYDCTLTGGDAGIRVFNNGTVSAGNLSIVNSDKGVWSQNGSTFRSSVAPVTFTGVTTAEFLADENGFIDVTDVAPVSGYRLTATGNSYIAANNVAGVVYSPAYGVVGNANSYIGV